MNLKGRIPVEPLDDERMTNIERRVVMGASEAAMAPRRAPARFGFAFAVAAVVVVAIGAGLAGWKLRGPSATPAPIATGEPVRVHTTSEQSTLDIGDATIASDPLTEYAVTRPDGGVLVTMKRGKVELSVGKRGERPPLVVAAGDTRVIVVGTKFSVDYGDGSGPVEVRVTEGVVRVERAQQTMRVAAGQAWSSTDKRGVVAIAELPPRAAKVATNETKPDEAKPDEVKPDEVTAEGTDIEIDTKTPDVLHDHASVVPDAQLPKQQVPVDKKPAKPELATRPSQPSGGSAMMDIRVRVMKQDVLPPLDLGLGTKESLAKYRDLAYGTNGNIPTGEPASIALYSIAATQHLKLGDNDGAEQTLDRYQRKFFGGQEAHSWASYKAALWLRVRIRCGKQIDERCRQAAFTYLHQVTDTPATRVAEDLTLAPR